MKRIRINTCALVSGACLALVLSSCISVPTSTTPRFYMLQAVHKNPVSQKMTVASDAFIGIGPVKIPEYLDRPQMVTLDQENMLKFAQFDRWGESLSSGIKSMIRENLTTMLPEAKFTSYPWNPSISVKYQVIIEIVRLDSALDKDLFFSAQWLVIDVQSMKTVITEKSIFKQTIVPQDYFGLAKTLSAACASLSSEIADKLTFLETHRL